MGLQIVFCVEAKKSSKTDYIYIKATVESFYSFDRANTRLSPIYLNGKGNYTSKKVCREITKYTKPILMLCDELDKIDPSEVESEEYKRILDLKNAILKYVAK